MAFQPIGSSNQLTIKSLADAGSSPIRFPAYLDSSEIGYIIDSKDLPFAPLSFINSKVHLRTRQKLSVKFNVYSVDSSESVTNYKNFENIIEWIKPKYKLEQGQYLADAANNTGLISLSFAGLQKTHKGANYGDDLKLHLTNFVYSINKDMGFHSSSLGALTPVGYSLQIDGDILLEFDKTATVSNNNKPSEKVNVFGESTTPDQRSKIIQFYEKVTVERFENLSSSGMQQVAILLTEEAMNSYSVQIPTTALTVESADLLLRLAKIR